MNERIIASKNGVTVLQMSDEQLRHMHNKMSEVKLRIESDPELEQGRVGSVHDRRGSSGSSST
jgi:hypothetical protein